MTAAPESASILVVDDDRVNRVLLVRSLETLGHRVVTASNGREALDRLQVEEPDWVSVPRHSSFLLSLRMRRGDADLFAYQRWVPTINTRSGGFRRRGLTGASRRPGRKRDAIFIDNPGRAARLAVAVRIYHPFRTLDAEYTLSARRLRH